MKVKIGVILDAIEMADDNYTYFLDLETGESVFLADELIKTVFCWSFSMERNTSIC